jgi:hypothetical protein
LPCSEVDRSTREDQLSHLGREPRRIDQGHPAALAQANEIDAAADLVNQNVEIGEVGIDREEAHLGIGGAPVGYEHAV